MPWMLGLVYLIAFCTRFEVSTLSTSAARVPKPRPDAAQCAPDAKFAVVSLLAEYWRPIMSRLGIAWPQPAFAHAHCRGGLRCRLDDG
nr:hypothetical protein [Burkholderia gladioli]